ncbi:MAG: dTDP-4-dehydrorhamnose 3,5-epimerase, partial [Bacteroidota bacterium]
MTLNSTPIPGLLVLEPRVFGDERGYFFESLRR